MATARWRSWGGRGRLVTGLAGGFAVAVAAAAVLVVGGTGAVDVERASSEPVAADAPAPGGSGVTVSPVDGVAERVAEAERRAAQREAAEAERRAAQREAAEAERRAAQEEAAEAERRAAQEEAAEAERRAAEEAQQLVRAQERLVELGYLVGAADGEHGQQTVSALLAFQAVNGLTPDGALGPQTLEALASPRNEPRLRGGPATRIEVDMDLQVLHLVEGERRVATLNASTGRGGTFESESGETLRAETPVGTFTIDRRIRGEHASSYGIGSMWDPMYFYGPWAIHGSPDVPAGPASAGCVRVAMADGRWLFDRVPDGTPVVLYGGTHVFTP